MQLTARYSQDSSKRTVLAFLWQWRRFRCRRLVTGFQGVYYILVFAHLLCSLQITLINQVLIDFFTYQSEQLALEDEKVKNLDEVAHFLANMADAWKQATQEQRNKLAMNLFEQIRVEDKRVVFVKPRPELEPFFKLSFECHAKDIAGDPEGI